MLTTLVPAFKPEFFLPLLRSLGSQTTKPRRVIISDDTEANSFAAVVLKDDSIRNLLKSLDGKIVRGPQKGYHENIRNLLAEFQKAPTDFFHILLDDDEIAPHFYEDHMQAHKSFNTMCCVSRRLILREPEKEPSVLAIPLGLNEIAPGQIRIPLEYLIKSLVVNGEWNWLGELSSMTLRREFLDIEAGFNTFGGIGLEGLNDIGTLLKSASKSDILFMKEPRGFFRINNNSISSKRGFFFSLSILGGIPLAISLNKSGRLSRADVLTVTKRVLEEWRTIYGDGCIAAILSEYCSLCQQDYDRFQRLALDFWSAYRALFKYHRDISTREELILFLETRHPFLYQMPGVLDD